MSLISTEMVLTITMIIFSINAHALSSLSTNVGEGEALLSIGWWNNSTSHCTWPDVICNEAGSAIGITIFNSDKELGELSKLKFSSFPNLVQLMLYHCGLNGNIPLQIGVSTVAFGPRPTTQ